LNPAVLTLAMLSQSAERLLFRAQAETPLFMVRRVTCRQSNQWPGCSHPGSLSAIGPKWAMCGGNPGHDEVRSTLLCLLGPFHASLRSSPAASLRTRLCVRVGPSDAMQEQHAFCPYPMPQPSQRRGATAHTVEAVVTVTVATETRRLPPTIRRAQRVLAITVEIGWFRLRSLGNQGLANCRGG
jgi:hypothetical protein